MTHWLVERGANTPTFSNDLGSRGKAAIVQTQGDCGDAVVVQRLATETLMPSAPLELTDIVVPHWRRQRGKAHCQTASNFY